MLAGTVNWPEDLAERYRREGWWDGSTLFGLLQRSAARWSDKTALVAGERRLSYADLQQQATRLAARLLALGIAPRDRVVMQLPNIIEFAIVYFALARIGAIPVMALRSHRHAEVRHSSGPPAAWPMSSPTASATSTTATWPSSCTPRRRRCAT